MGELAIKIKIAEREYPMRVAEDEEERVRLAARMVNERVKQFKEMFGIDDKQDLLAMIAFDLLAEKLKTEESRSGNEALLEQKLTDLDSLLSSFTSR